MLETWQLCKSIFWWRRRRGNPTGVGFTMGGKLRQLCGEVKRDKAILGEKNGVKERFLFIAFL